MPFYYRKTYQFHADGARAQAGRFVAEDMGDAMHQVERRLGYAKPLDWWADGNRMVARPHGTRVVVYRRWGGEDASDSAQ